MAGFFVLWDVTARSLQDLDIRRRGCTFTALANGNAVMTILDLSAHFSRFRSVPGRIHLAGHSHHYWPDVTREAHLLAWDDACRLADRKWGHVFGEVIPWAS
jgi:hypothetical protein